MREFVALVAQASNPPDPAPPLDFINVATNIAVMILVFIFLGFIIYKLRQFASVSHEPAMAELEFESQLMAQMLGPQAGRAPGASTTGASGGVALAPKVPSARQPSGAVQPFLSSAPVSPHHEREAVASASTLAIPAAAPLEPAPRVAPKWNDDEDDQKASATRSGAGSSEILADAAALRALIERLRAIRPDLRENGRIGNLGSGLETASAWSVSWDNGRMTAAILDRMPPASALPTLFRRFEIVVIASSSAEPVVIDRLGAYFARGVML